MLATKHGTYGIEGITVEEIGGPTCLRCAGKPEPVNEWFTKLCGQYHPAGYGTMIRKTSLADGILTIETWRASSCD